MKSLWWAIIVFVLKASLAAEIVPLPGSQDVEPIFRKADLVCNCVVTTVRVVEEAHIQRAGKPITTQRLIAILAVSDLYKPDSLDGQIVVSFETEIPSTRASQPELRQGERALMFLNVVSGSYVLADPFIGVVPLQNLSTQSRGIGLRKLEAALIAELQAKDREERIRALQLLDGFHLRPDAAAALVPLSNSSDSEVSLPAFVALIKIKSEDNSLSDNLLRLRNYIESSTGRLDAIGLANLCGALRKISDPRTVMVMESLATSRFIGVRRAAMQSLRNSRDRNAATTLISRLDDPDQDVRYLAVITLAETFEKYDNYAPSMYLFDQNPQHYIDLWKHWWRTEGKGANLPNNP